MIEEEIEAAVGPLVQGHVHPLRRPQRPDASTPEELPVVVYTIVGDDWETAETLCAPGLHAMRVQLDVYASTYRDARSLAYAVALAMDGLGWRLSLQSFPNDEERIVRWLLEFSCWRNDRPEDIPAWDVTRQRRRTS